ncbi:hypothetical protein GCM10027590_66260 [Nocardiopsis nanhaiensis]
MRESATAAVLATGFSVATATAGVAVPLLAAQDGLGAPLIGAFVALSGAAQILTRISMPWLLRTLSDRTLLATSVVFTCLSCGLLGFIQNTAAYVSALVLQGAARALFWTSSQTHAVRMSSSPISGVASVGMSAGAGALVGAVLAGAVSDMHSPAAALSVAAGVAAVALVPASMLTRLPPYARRTARRRTSPLWNRAGVRAACWSNVTAGAWRSMLDSFVPLLLVASNYSSFSIGVLVATGNLAVIVGTWAADRLNRWLGPALLPLAVTCTALGIGMLGIVAAWSAPVIALLVLSGAGTGIVQTTSPALASRRVEHEDQGSAIASTGTFRASALLAAPAAMGGMLAFTPFAGAFLAMGMVIALPSLVKR